MDLSPAGAKSKQKIKDDVIDNNLIMHLEVYSSSQQLTSLASHIEKLCVHLSH